MSKNRDWTFWRTRFTWMACVLLLAVSSILKADFAYKDDIGRTRMGYRLWAKSSRYLSDILSVPLHGFTGRISDISPLPQVIAVLLMAAAGIIILAVFEETKKTAWAGIAAVLPLAVNPYFAECFAFKYDAPYMALSVAASVLPFLFAEKRRWQYLAVSAAGILVMCLTYQTAAGIYPMAAAYFCLSRWNDGRKSFRECIKFAFWSALCYILVMVFYHAVLIRKVPDYVETQIFPLRSLFPGIVRNMRTYYWYVRQDFTPLWLALAAIIMVSFIVGTVLISKRNRAAAFLAALLTAAFGGWMSFGLYSLMEGPLFRPRMMFGIGCWLSLTAVLAVQNSLVLTERSGQDMSLPGRALIQAVRWTPAAAAGMFGWCLLTFNLTFGNALTEQKSFTQYRMQMLIDDLMSMEGRNTDEPLQVILEGNIGKAPVLIRLQEDLPALKRLVPDTLGDYMWAGYYFFRYPGLPDIVEGEAEDFENLALPVLKETGFYTLQGDHKHLKVVFRQ